MKTEEEHLRAVLQSAYPAAEPSAALRQRVEALVAGTDPARFQEGKRRRKIGWHLAFVTATAVVIFAFLLLVPRLTAVYAFQRMTDSLHTVRSAHLTTWQIMPDGTHRKADETWYLNGQWRRELDDVNSKLVEGKPSRIEVCRNGKRWTYDCRQDTVTLEKAARPEGMQATKGFSIAAELDNNAAWGLRTQVRTLGTTALSGRPAHILELITKEHFEMHTQPNMRWHETVDDATDLPMRSELQVENNGRWITQYIGEMQYDVPLAASLFGPDFPKTAQFVDAIAGREEWRKRLSNGIASQMVGATSNVIAYPDPHDLVHLKSRGTNTPTQVVIRDFQVNAQGDVFLLFTANHAVGYGYNEVNAEVTDEFGTKYINPALQHRSKFAYLATNLDRTDASKLDGGYLFNNEMLEGIWWVPARPQNPWKPRRFTLTLRLPFVGNHGKPAVAVFDLPVGKPGADNLPDYMPYMARPLPAAWIGSEEAVTRAYYYQHDVHDLPQALAWYHRTIDLNSATARKFGQTPYNAYQWFDVFQVLMEMGRTQEAKAALLRAKADDDRALSPTETRPWIRAALEKLSKHP